MATTLKTWHPDFVFSGGKVGADEVDFYHTYTVTNPSIGSTTVATAAAIATTITLVENTQGVADYPRNLRVIMAGGTASGTYGGTVVIKGKDQFGNTISETFSIGTAVNGGTAIGTKVFAAFTSGTGTLAGDTAIATCNVGFGTGGTTTLFGLPFKVGGTADLLHYSWGSANTLSVAHSNALGSYVSTAYHAIKAKTDFVGGTTAFTVWVKSSKNQAEDLTNVTDGR